MFSTDTYIRRREALLERMSGEKGIVLFVGNVDSACQYPDNAYKFRQDSSWLYFFGIDEPGFSAVIDLESGDQTIFADDLTIDDIIWTGPLPSVAQQAALAGITATAPSARLDVVVREAVAKGRPVHFLPASRWWNALRISSLVGLKPREVMISGKKGCEKASRRLVEATVSLRLVKEPAEIEVLDRCARIGQLMHTVARKGIRIGRIEQEIVGEMEAVAVGRGWGLSFPTILTQHGEIFHCHDHSGKIEDGALMVIDAGVESNEHYASDFTRTYPTGGKFTARQREIYDIVSAAHDTAFGLAAPLVAYLDVHLAASRTILEGLRALGLVHGDIEDMLSQGIAGLFMPHGLGHNMGLDVHDMEDFGEDLVGYDPDQKRSAQLGLGSLRMARRLKPGNVVTDEPGIYFIPQLIEQWKAEGKGKDFIDYGKLVSYYDFGGIRLEDDVLVTEDGARRLGGARLPATADEIEEAMKND